MLIAKPSTSSAVLPLEAAATAITLSKLTLTLPAFVVAEQLHAYPQQQGAPNKLQVRHRQQLHGSDREHNSQQHRGARTQQHRLFLLIWWQRARCQSDNDSVVARQNDVNPDDLEQTNPEFWVV